jgi:putative transposase
MALPERKQNRLTGYDYSCEGLYFVTSCVQDKACVFGHVAAGEMQLNVYGKLAEKQWHWLEEQYPYIALHAFVVMPNHVHAIIEIDQARVGTGRDLSAHTQEIPSQSSDLSATSRSLPLRKIKSISELMGVYKTTTSKLIRQTGLLGFTWQRSFHDHIIRHETALRQIENYIYNNPSLWQEDVFYQDNPS